MDGLTIINQKVVIKSGDLFIFDKLIPQNLNSGENPRASQRGQGGVSRAHQVNMHSLSLFIILIIVTIITSNIIILITRSKLFPPYSSS